jgi:amyloid beta precursor protein binding protein 1
MGARICLLVAGPTGTESLKNLVLPGVGSITIVDSGLVSERDCANNFFVSAAHLSRPRAQVALELLLEMNADVRGEAVLTDPLTLIASDLPFFERFSLVIATQLSAAQVAPLAAFLYEKNIALLVRALLGLTDRSPVPSFAHAGGEGAGWRRVRARLQPPSALAPAR